jgi:hypothetical protein
MLHEWNKTCEHALSRETMTEVVPSLQEQPGSGRLWVSGACFGQSLAAIWIVASLRDAYEPDP